MGPILSNINNIIGDDTFRWNEAGQSSHANGATLSCLRIWVIRLELWLKLFPQTRHWCGFSPEKNYDYGYGFKEFFNRVFEKIQK